MPLGIHDLAEKLGIHANTVRFHLDALTASGQVERAEPTRGVPGRPAQRYQAIRRMDPDGRREFGILAGLLTRSLAGVSDGPRRALEAGRSMGAELAADLSDGADTTEGLRDFLDALGFAAEIDGDEVRLHNCPFLELAEDDPSIVCQAHLGLMRGAAHAWDRDLRVTTLAPFAEPDLCVARLHHGASRSAVHTARSTS